MPTIPILLIIIIFMTGAFLKGWSGFGTNLVVPPLLIMLGYDPIIALVITISVNIFLNIAMTLESKQISFKNLQPMIPLLISAVFGHIIGLVILKGSDPSVIKIVLGLMILFVVGNRIFKFNFHIEQPKKYYIPIGIVSGLLNGMAGLGGIPFLLLLTSSNYDKEKFKSTLVSYFLLMNILSIVGYAAADLYSVYIFTNMVYALLPAVLICMVGVYMSRRVSPKLFNKVMNVVLIFFGINLIYGAIFGKHIFLMFS